MIWVLAIIAVTMFIYGKKVTHKPDYMTFFVMGIIWTIFGLALKVTLLTWMGILFAFTGLIHYKKWEENYKRKLIELNPNDKRIKTLVTIILCLLLMVAVILLWFAYTQTR
jgi:hypothetical protein